MTPAAHQPPSRAARPAPAAFGVDLALAGARLSVTSATVDLIEHVSAVMVPPCRKSSCTPSPDWYLRLENAVALADEEVDVLFADRPLLSFPHGGPRLAIVRDSGGHLQAVGRYRPQSAAVCISVDVAEHRTHIMLPAGDQEAIRWADYVARVFFASRMQASGWRMLHASAVVLDGTAVLFLAAQGGGKSTLAHRACTELGARFLADDLVLVSGEGTVVGWPTRVALSAELVRSARANLGTVTAGARRDRVVFSPAEHRAAFGMAYSLPVPLGALVCVKSGVHAADPVAAQASVLGATARETFVAKAADVPAQRLFVSDLVGLTGGPPPSRNGAVFDTDGRLCEVPAVLLTVGDLFGLTRAPVWEALAPLLSQFGRL